MTYAGISTITIENIMEDVAFALVEPIVNTTLGTAVTVPGSSTVTSGSMTGIYVGAIILVDTGGNQEQITVTAVTATTFTAVFTILHSAAAVLVGSTFPSGQIDHPLFTQDEIFGYLADVQNDFLLKTRCIFGVTGTFSEPSNIPLSNGIRYYSQPPQAVRVERIAGNNGNTPPALTDLYETTQSDLDAENGYWEADAGPSAQWFRDNIDSSKFGVYPLPNSGGTLELWYSKRGLLGNAANFFLAETLLIPDVMSHYIKYGVLARCFSKDGESHDPLRADYCKHRFDLGVVLVQRFMEGIGIQAQPKTPQTFSPMAISREPAEVTGG